MFSGIFWLTMPIYKRNNFLGGPFNKLANFCGKKKNFLKKGLATLTTSQEAIQEESFVVWVKEVAFCLAFFFLPSCLVVAP